MGFQIGNLMGRNISARQRGLNDHFLGYAIRRRKTIAGAILINGTAFDNCQNSISGVYCILNPFQDNHRAAFTTHIAVGGGCEGFTFSIR